MTGLATLLATVKDLKHLFGVLEQVLHGNINEEPPNTPVVQNHSQLGADILKLKQLLVKVIRDRSESPMAN